MSKDVKQPRPTQEPSTDNSSGAPEALVEGGSPAVDSEPVLLGQVAAQVVGCISSPRLPTVGRVVTFRQPGRDAEIAAMITGVHNATLVDLAVFFPGEAPTFAVHVCEGVPGSNQRCWHWPVF